MMKYEESYYHALAHFMGMENYIWFDNNGVHCPQWVHVLASLRLSADILIVLVPTLLSIKDDEDKVSAISFISENLSPHTGVRVVDKYKVINELITIVLLPQNQWLSALALWEQRYDL